MIDIRPIKIVAAMGLAWTMLTAASAPASTGEQIADLLDANKPIEAFALAQEKAGEGDPEAQFALGWFYDSGQHITADKARAAAYYRKCADQGLSQCQWRLGVMYDIGEGVEADPKAAFDWIAKAAVQKNAERAIEPRGHVRNRSWHAGRLCQGDGGL
ncbi:tetratricopeptide repeat protein [Sphingopyxis sp. PET50]|uniref:tetratricopeptide repeat protein n=1 Tax=Sphingopyxis sp. PET50 TaxID=2976533 RepID=UPI0021AE8B0A|nr:tetratricopeptide repeat protein [Sphingopyxis sp. PET50]